MAKGDVHQSWDSSRQQWKLQREGSSRASGYRDTAKEGAEWGQHLAKTTGNEWLKHRKESGQIHQRNTYGKNDPNPPKG